MGGGPERRKEEQKKGREGEMTKERKSDGKKRKWGTKEKTYQPIKKRRT